MIHYQINGTLIPPRRNVTTIVASYGPNVKSFTGNMLAFLKVSFFLNCSEIDLKSTDLFFSFVFFFLEQHEPIVVQGYSQN